MTLPINNYPQDYNLYPDFQDLHPQEHSFPDSALRGELTDVTEELAVGNWEARTACQLRGRFKKVTSKWTPSEDRILIYLVEALQNDFAVVMTHFPGRSAKACRSRYAKLLHEKKLNEAIDPAGVLSEGRIERLKNLSLSEEEQTAFRLLKIAGTPLTEISIQLKRSLSLCKRELRTYRHSQNQLSGTALQSLPFKPFFPVTRAMEKSYLSVRYTPDFFQPGEGLEQEPLFFLQ